MSVMKRLQANAKGLEKIEHLASDFDVATVRLLELAKDNDAEVRMRAVEALGKLRGVEVSSAVVGATTDRDELVRVEAVEVLGSWGEERYGGQLLASLRDRSWLVRSAAAVALGDIGSLFAKDALLKGLQKASEGERVGLLYALAKLGHEGYELRFLDGLFSEDYRVRCATANLCIGLATRGGESTVRRLVKLALQSETTAAARSALESALDAMTEWESENRRRKGRPWPARAE